MASGRSEIARWRMPVGHLGPPLWAEYAIQVAVPRLQWSAGRRVLGVGAARHCEGTFQQQRRTKASTLYSKKRSLWERAKRGGQEGGRHGGDGYGRRSAPGYPALRADCVCRPRRRVRGVAGAATAAV